MVLPNEIGSAAAYEAYRSWKHHAMLYQPLGGDSTREREGLVGLAVAEGTFFFFRNRLSFGLSLRIVGLSSEPDHFTASRLWNYSGRPMDTFAIRHAMEAAASTASMLYYRVSLHISIYFLLCLIYDDTHLLFLYIK